MTRGTCSWKGAQAPSHSHKTSYFRQNSAQSFLYTGCTPLQFSKSIRSEKNDEDSSLPYTAMSPFSINFLSRAAHWLAASLGFSGFNFLIVASMPVGVGAYSKLNTGDDASAAW